MGMLVCPLSRSQAISWRDSVTALSVAAADVAVVGVPNDVGVDLSLAIRLASLMGSGPVGNPELEDCNLVLTTSKGQVTIAPVVPPTL